LSERENKVTAFCHALGRYKKRKGTGGGGGGGTKRRIKQKDIAAG
jgi:hypothetical protein